MNNFFKNIPEILSVINPDDFNKKIQYLFIDIGGKLYLNNLNLKPSAEKSKFDQITTRKMI